MFSTFGLILKILSKLKCMQLSEFSALKDKVHEEFMKSKFMYLCYNVLQLNVFFNWTIVSNSVAIELQV